MTKPRIEYLDSLRGIAALMVVTSHFLERTPLRDTWFLSHFNLGQFGVVIFFILSGMVIPYSLGNSKQAIKKFITSRFFRLYPAYWLSVLFAVLSAILFTDTLPEIKTIAFNLTMIQSLFNVPDLFGVYWTLIIELIFYALCVLLFVSKLLHNIFCSLIISVAMLLVASIAAYTRWQLEMKIPVAVPLAMSLMFFGVLWREATINDNKRALNYSVVWICSFIVMLPVICFLAYSKNFGFSENPIAYWATYTSALLFFLLFTSIIKIISRYLVFMGTISYSLYLLHQFFLELISSNTSIGSGFNLVYFCFYITIVIVASTISYFTIEKPSVKFCRNILNGQKIRYALTSTPHNKSRV
ncbi:acyltransferase family protein [Yersinia frederiksenii]|uniref:acyltransferase family protein n=1 Tax=Yersinia frederiksenii TaxID=29484 RepID=UPI0005DE5682|nr:acyltransferase [Yersinia frederiksenii]CNF37719.1 Fucose 4-O-acetylase and related acetyltransferases [Yersinia frederiksenii]